MKRYEEKQKEMIRMLQQKSLENEYAAIANKVPKLSADIEKALGKDSLLQLLVTLDYESEKLELRKEELKKKM